MSGTVTASIVSAAFAILFTALVAWLPKAARARLPAAKDAQRRANDAAAELSRAEASALRDKNTLDNMAARQDDQDAYIARLLERVEAAEQRAERAELRTGRAEQRIDQLVQVLREHDIPVPPPHN